MANHLAHAKLRTTAGAIVTSGTVKTVRASVRQCASRRWEGANLRKGSTALQKGNHIVNLIVQRSGSQRLRPHLGLLMFALAITGCGGGVGSTAQESSDGRAFAGSNAPLPVSLGTAGTFAILTKTGISTVPSSSVTGDIGVSPAAATYLTGFSLVADPTNLFSRSPQVVGKAYAANYAVPTPANMTTAVSDMQTAYSDAAGRIHPNFLELHTGNLGGLTLVPGLYKWTSSMTMPTTVTISGRATDVWIFQTSGNVTMASAVRINLSGGARAKNIFWQVAGNVALGTTSHFEGILLCKTDVTLKTGATMNGRILSQTAVALQQATVTQPPR